MSCLCHFTHFTYVLPADDIAQKILSQIFVHEREQILLRDHPRYAHVEFPIDQVSALDLMFTRIADIS
jgi:hypothetical protein